MNKKYAAIEWVDEPNKYSSVKVSRVVYDSKVLNEESHFVNQIFDIKLDKSSEEIHTGKVLQIGSRAKISKSVADLASAASETSFADDGPSSSVVSTRLKNVKRKADQSEEIASLKMARTELVTVPSTLTDNVLVVVDQNNIEDCPQMCQVSAGEVHNDGIDGNKIAESNTAGNNDSDEKDRIIKALEVKLRKKDHCIKLQKDLALHQQDKEDSVDIGEGIMVSRRVVTELKMDYRQNAGIFLRKLMEMSGLFTLEEIANSSVTGQRYRDGTQRPRLYSRRFKACKDFIITKCKLKDHPLKMVQFEKSVANICTDARKRLKKNILNN